MKSWLERLEISVVPLASLERTLRVDAEFYSKKNLLVASQLSAMPHIPITDAFDVSDGNHMSISDDFQESGVPYYRGQDSCHMFIEDASPVCIGLRNYQKTVMQRSHLHKDDVLLSIVGTIGNVSYVATEEKAICSCKLAILRAKHRTISPECLYLFLQTTYGQNQIQKFRRGAVQMGLILEDMDQLMIPLFSDRFQAALKQTIAKLYEMDSAARKNYQDAEACLAQAIGYYDYQPAKQQNSVRSLNEILSAGRIDAEYYQPKYDAILQQLARISDGTIGTRCNIYDQNFTPEAATTYRYIELADIGNQGIITGCTTDTGDNLPTRARRIVHTGNLLVPSIEGSLQSMALVSDAYDSALCSTGFFVLDADDINSETLLVLFKSAPMQALLKRQCAGTILTGFDKDALCSIPLPVIPLDVQKQIQASVRQSFELRAQAVTLLATARRAVECFIEQGEAAALAVLAPDSEA